MKKSTNEEVKKRGLSTRQIALTATFLAINVAISAFSSRLGTQKLTMTYTICFLAGYIQGPFGGGLVGGGADLMGCFINGFAPNPIILLSSCLIGIIPGIIRYIRPKKDYPITPYLHCVASYLVVYVACTTFINTAGLYLLSGFNERYDSFFAYVAYRLSTQTGVWALNLILTMIIIPIIKKIKILTNKK